MKPALALMGSFVLVAATALAGGDADKKALQGNWEGSDKGESFQFSVDGNKWSLKLKDKKDAFFFKGTFTLGAKGKLKTIDMKIEDGGKEIDRYKGKSSLGIYEFEGDVLKWCSNEPGETDRPMEFSDKGKALFIQFKRVK